MRSKALASFLGSMCLFFGLWFVTTMPFQTHGLPLSSPWEMTWEENLELVRPPFYRLIEQPRDTRLSTHFSRADLGRANTLYLPRPYCHGLRIEINGFEVTHFGDFEERSANIWNSVIKVPIPLALIKDTNQLTLIMANLHDVGFGGIPYLGEYKKLLHRDIFVRFLDQELYLFAIGGSLLLGLILLLVSMGVPDHKKVFRYLGLSTLLASVFFLDYQFRLSTGATEPFLLFRKVVNGSGYLATFFLLLGTEYLLLGNPKLARWMVWPTWIAIFAFFIQPTHGSFVAISNLTNFIILVNPIIVIVWVVKKWYVPLIFPMCFLGCTIAHTVFKTIFPEKSQPYLLVYGVLICILYFGVYLVESYKKSFLKLKTSSLLDPLTQAFNRGVLGKHRFEQGDSLAMIDIDGFKQLNDTYGHEYGDQVLVKLVDTFKKTLRKSDLIIRFGGDEFMLLFHQCPEAKAFSILTQSIQELKTKFPDNEISFSFGVAEIKDDFNHALILADKALYKMKSQTTKLW